MSALDKPVGKYTAQHRDALHVYQMACKLLEAPPDQRKAITDAMAPELLNRCRKEAQRLLKLRA